MPICDGVTALTLDLREVLILEFRKGLWFETRIGKITDKPKPMPKVWDKNIQ